MSSSGPPFDDTVQLETMEQTEYTDSDTAPIYPYEREMPPPDDVPHVTVTDPRMDERGAPLVGRKRAYVTVAILLLINLLNYMDRFTIAGKFVYVALTLSLVVKKRKGKYEECRRVTE